MIRSFLNLPFLLLLTVFYSSHSFAQVQERISGQSRSVNTILKDLEEAVRKGEDKRIRAELFEELAEEFRQLKGFIRSKKYFEKALEVYLELDDQEKIAQLYRKLARLYEATDDIGNAISNYQSSNTLMPNPSLHSLNSNDIHRLQLPGNSTEQESLISSNIRILEDMQDTSALLDELQLKAEKSIQRNESENAIESYERAFTKARSNRDSIKLKQALANAYKIEQQYHQAIETLRSGMKGAKENADFEKYTELSLSLAGIYFQNENPDSAVAILEESYLIALDNGITNYGAQITMLLADYFETRENWQQSLNYYRQFQNDLGNFLISDNSLVEARILNLTEEKIEQLEKEKALQNELIEKKNLFNYGLMASVGALSIFLLFLTHALRMVRQRNRKIALQSLRREMNPHFIFNSLNSVNQFIAQNNELGANKYLSAYSGLMRQVMEFSNKDFLLLSDEIVLVQQYLDLEHLRFADVFDYELTVDDTLEQNSLCFPNMLVQPHIENAIWHGLRYKEQKGRLKVSFKDRGDKIEVIVADNGIGRSKSRELKTENQQIKNSRGQSNVIERIELLNKLYECHIRLSIEELEENTGTRVVIHVNKISGKYGKNQIGNS